MPFAPTLPDCRTAVGGDLCPMLMGDIPAPCLSEHPLQRQSQQRLWLVFHGKAPMAHDHGSGSPAPTQDALKVIIADDDPLARRAIRDALQEQGMVVIAEAAEGHDAIELVLHYDPDVVLMDVVLPRVDGIAATHRILKDNPGVVVIMMSANEDPELGLLCLRSGAAGFLPKTVSLEALPRVIRAAAAGEPVVTRSLTAALIERLRRSSSDGSGLRPVRSQLTPREWEVLDLLCQRLSTD